MALHQLCVQKVPSHGQAERPSPPLPRAAVTPFEALWRNGANQPGPGLCLW